MSRARQLASLLDVNGDVVSTALDNADQEVSQADVTQHEAALSITESQISDLGDYATSSELTTAIAGFTSVQSDVHAFYVDANGDLQWEHSTDVTALQDSNNEDIYDLVIIGSDDQSYSIDASGQLVLTIS